MADIIVPAELNERFTVYLNAEGKPVQRTLREMTVNEVLLAFEAGRAEEIAHLEKHDVVAAISLLRRAGEAMERDVRLMLNFGQALRRYWPFGRAA
jgi:hypothetical protein